MIAALLFIAFMGAGFSKLTAQRMMVAQFASFGYPVWFMYVTGLIEIAGALLVIVPRTSRLGAALLACVMLGALFSHLTHGQTAMLAPPFVLLLLALAELQLRGGLGAPLLSKRRAV